MTQRELAIALAGRLAVAGVLLLYAAYAFTHLGGLRWNFDEGIEVHKAWLAADGYRLFDPIWTDQPIGHTVLLALVFRLVDPGMPQARALTVGFGLIGMAATAVAAREIARDVAGPRTPVSAAGGDPPSQPARRTWSPWLAAASAGLVLAIAPNFNWASRAVMIGIPTFSIATLSMAFAIGYARRQSTRWLAACALALGLSLAIKVQMIYLGPLFAVVVLWLRRRRPALLATELGLLALLGLGPLALMMAAYGPTPVWAQVFGTYLETRDDYELDLAANVRVLATWTRADNLGLALLAAGGALLCLRRRSAAAALTLAWLVLTVLTPLQHAALWAEDHFEPLLFCLCALAGVALATLSVHAVEMLRGARTAGAPGPEPAGDGHRVPTSRIWIPIVCVVGLAAYILWLPHVAAVNRSLGSARGYENDGTIVAPGTPYWREVEESEAQMRSAIDYLAARSGPDDWVMTDDQILAFHAGRRVPPELAAMSSRRVRIRAISGSELIDLAERYDPAVILPWKGQFIHFDSFAEWLPTARTADASWTETRIAYLRRAAEASPN